MSYLALARKWRPRNFEEVVGQDHVVTALSNALNTQRVHHAFLFTGTRGVGKTTLARIFAKALNCESGITASPCDQCAACTGVDNGNFMDLIEVDAASRTKVDDTRDLLENVQYTPTQGRFKIYLIDEVHMLSLHSFNALLKTLEEPPEHVKFLLATTNPQKLPTTILSRCIQFNLKSVEGDLLAGQLEKILVAESVEFDAAALQIIARSARGSVRDSLSLLDQAIAFGNGEVRVDMVRSMLGMIDDSLVFDLLGSIADGDCERALQVVADMSSRSVDFSGALDELLTQLHNLMVYQFSPTAIAWKGINEQEVADLATRFDPETLQLVYQIAVSGKRDFDFAPDPRSGFEITVIRMIAFKPDDGNPNSKPAPRITRETEKSPGTRSPAAQPDPRAQTASKESVGVRDQVAEPFTVAEQEQPASASHSESQNPREEAAQANRPSTPRANGGFQIDDLLDTGKWHQFVEQIGLSGIPREILMNLVPRSLDGSTISASLDQASRALFNSDRRKKIEQQCSEFLGFTIQLEVDIADLAEVSPDRETPSQRNNRQQEEARDQARETFSTDENVREMVRLFDGEVVTDSIHVDKQVTES